MTKTQAWIKAFRLRTLPLSVSGVILGSLLALSKDSFDVAIFIMAIVTTLFLQVLSNLANDYGDSKNGKDNEGRIGPERMVQSGFITLPEMKKMVILFCLLSLISGITLLSISNIAVASYSFYILLGLGMLSIWAALFYTIGKNPYGYSGWGDISVFIFFGLFSVSGTFFLYTGNISADIFLPAISVGLFSVGVLNINNLRDQQNDKTTGKKTLVVKMGTKKAKVYHYSLLAFAVISSLAYLIVNKVNAVAFLYLIIIIPVACHIIQIASIKEHVLFDKELKKLALIALLYSLTFGFAINL